jgi:hypothetical protein
MSAILRIIPFDPEWASRLRSMDNAYFYEDMVGKPISSPMEQLAWSILEHGGVCIILEPRDPQLSILCERGEVFGVKNRKSTRRKSCNCHQNSAQLWDDYKPLLEIVTGYALTNDGLWRQHTWCRRVEDGKIFETTVARDLYYGVRLTQKESKAFYQAECCPVKVRAHEAR